MESEKIKYRVIQSNLLVESRHKLTLSEIKLFLWMVRQISINDKDFQTYRIWIKDFMDCAKIDRSRFYSEAKEVTKSFLSKVLELKEDDGMRQVNFMSSVKYYDGKAYIEYDFHPSLKRHLLRLGKAFTNYDIRNIILCRSVYSIRIYQILKAWEGLGERIVSLEDLKYMLVIEDQYKRWADFRRYVLNAAQKELKKFSDLFFSFKPVKQGRKVQAVHFIIEKQRQKRLFDGKESDPNHIEIAPSHYQDLTSKAEKMKQEIESGEVVNFDEFKGQAD